MLGRCSFKHHIYEYSRELEEQNHLPNSSHNAQTISSNGSGSSRRGCYLSRCGGVEWLYLCVYRCVQRVSTVLSRRPSLARHRLVHVSHHVSSRLRLSMPRLAAVTVGYRATHTARDNVLARAYSKRVPRTNCALRIKKCAPRISSGIYFLSTRNAS